jgi:hypothetical protein
MTTVDLYILLDSIYKADFLNSIELVYENTNDYKKSEFYKKTKIPLEVLYEKYFHYMTVNYSFDEKLDNFIEGIDPDTVSDLFLKIMDNLENNEEFMKKIESLVNSFNIEDLKEQNEELSKIAKTLK